MLKCNSAANRWRKPACVCFFFLSFELFKKASWRVRKRSLKDQSELTIAVLQPCSVGSHYVFALQSSSFEDVKVFFPFSLREPVWKRLSARFVWAVTENVHISAQQTCGGIIQNVWRQMQRLLRSPYSTEYLMFLRIIIFWGFATLIVAPGFKAWHSWTCVSYALGWKMNGSCVAYTQQDVG